MYPVREGTHPVTEVADEVHGCVPVVHVRAVEGCIMNGHVPGLDDHLDWRENDDAEAAWAATGAPYPLSEVPKPTDLPDLSKPGVPLVSESTLRLARETAHALEMIAGGWPELSSQGFRDYLNDGAAAIYDLAIAIEEMQRPLQ